MSMNSKYSFFKADQKETKRIDGNYKDEEKYDNPRNMFMRDRDRILYSSAFRRLSGKTQVFAVGYDDHARTRLTHTLEVAQIAKSIGASLGLNIDLIEAIALGHDIGHTPFGHVGERTLNHIMNACDMSSELGLSWSDKGFKHNLQGLRVVSDLELLYEDNKGLNLTQMTMWGIAHHSKIKCVCEPSRNKSDFCRFKKNHSCEVDDDHNFCYGFYDQYLSQLENAWSVEALVVGVADEIAQRHHDLEDGLLAKIVSFDELYTKIEDIFKTEFNTDEEKIFEKVNVLTTEKPLNYEKFTIQLLSKLIISILERKLVENTKKQLDQLILTYGIDSHEKFHEKKNDIWAKGFDEIKKIVSYEKKFEKLEDKLRKFLKTRVLESHVAQSMDGKDSYIIRQLFKAYLTNPQQLPDKTVVNIFRLGYRKDLYDKYSQNKSKVATDKYSECVGMLRQELTNAQIKDYKNLVRFLLRIITDYISGMTDQYAYEQYELLYGERQISNSYIK